MTALLIAPPGDDLNSPPLDDAYETFWHAMEDDVGVPDFDEDERTGDRDDELNDVYSTFVSSIEA